MSRLLRRPCTWQSNVQVALKSAKLSVKGPKGALDLDIEPCVKVELGDSTLSVHPADSQNQSRIQAATTQALIKNMITGVSEGFQRKMLISGVGYRGQTKGKTIELTLGLSHPVVFNIPEGIEVKFNSQTDFDIHGCNKQLVGEVAAQLRRLRPPEPYGGKGIRLADETIVRKVVKKK